MAIFKRGKKGIYWYDFTINEIRYRGSTKTTQKDLAQRYEDELKTQIWRQIHLKEKPHYTWDEAVIRFVKENTHKSIEEYNKDISKLTWFTRHLTGKKLKDITKQDVEALIKIKLEEDAASQATANRYLAVIKTLFRKAERKWEWIDRAPIIDMYKEPEKRIRWITKEEASRLLSCLPDHLADMAQFALATGLRQYNVLNLRWEEVNLTSRLAWVHPEDAKAGRAISVPLNNMAMKIIKAQTGKHDTFVFTYNCKPLKSVDNKTWKAACKRAGITNFKWHDLRHTWASWHAQAGTPIQTLMELGGWRSLKMVLRYAHLSDAHLKSAADKINLEFDKEDKLRRVK
jgi:integrase